MRSPTEISMSSSRGFGRGGDLVGERGRARRSCRPSPRARRRRGSRPRCAATSRRATSLQSAPGRRPTCRRTSSRPCRRSGVGASSGEGSGSGLEARSVGHRSREVASGSHLAAAGERPAERDLVGVLEVAADGQAAREARHAHAAAQPVGEDRRPSPRRSCSGSSRARPPRRRSARRGRAARRCAGARARRRRSARASRRARGRGRGTRASARREIRSAGCSTTQMSVWSRRASRQIAQRSSSVRLPHSRQKRTRSFTSSIARGERERLLLRRAQQVEREPLRGALARRRAGASAARRGSRRTG